MDLEAIKSGDKANGALHYLARIKHFRLRMQTLIMKNEDTRKMFQFLVSEHANGTVYLPCGLINCDVYQHINHCDSLTDSSGSLQSLKE